MPNLIDRDHCCGCSACASQCPKGAIIMKPNEEGFLHPEIDTVLCVECGSCESVCSGLAPALNIDAEPVAYIVQNIDDDVRYQSTSGGAFTAIASEIIRRDGVVFGVAMTDNMEVVHIYVDTIAQLSKFRNSKYVQSRIGDSYKRTKDFLLKDRWVCFSGTPCQINGLYKYLGKDYEKLIAVDVVCKSIPSPLVFDKYVEFKKQQEGNISDIVFRDKKRGFLYCTMAHYGTHDARANGNSQYRKGSESDEWLRLFLSGKISRRSCISCPFQTKERVGDFTLGDIWETGFASFDDNKGSTLVHVWTPKGKLFFDSIKDNIRFEEYPSGILKGIERNNTIQLYSKRQELFFDVYSLSPVLFFKKYAPTSFKIKIKSGMRYILWCCHIQNFVRHIKHEITNKNR